MEVALRRRLAGVAEISISQREQKAVVTFHPGTSEFSLVEFRNALAEADVSLVGLEVETCGVVGDDGTLRSSVGGTHVFVRLHGGDTRVGSALCVTGPVDDGVHPYVLHITTSRPWS